MLQSNVIGHPYINKGISGEYVKNWHDAHASLASRPMKATTCL